VPTILVATADREERRTLAQAFRVTGNKVVEVEDAGGTLELLEQQPPDALVLDPRLPGLEISQLLRHIRRNPALTRMKVSLLAHDMDAKLWEFLGRQFFDVVVEQHGIDAAGFLAAGGETARPGRTGAKATRGGTGKTKALRKTQALSRDGEVRRILVVEDEPTYCVLLGTEFQALGWTTVGVDSAEAGLEILKKDKIDAALSDINLPGMPGNEFAAVVRRDFPKVKIVLMSGMPQDRYPKVPKEIPILPKPISVRELMSAMRFLKQG
jgi:CheY-like chemotaxis protein